MRWTADELIPGKGITVFSIHEGQGLSVPKMPSWLE